MRASARETYLVDHYIRAFGLTAVYCGVALKSGRTLLGRCRNFKAHRQALAAEHGKIDIYGLWWCSDDAKAKHLLALLPARCPAIVARDRLPQIAATERISLMPDTEVRARSLANVEALKDREAPTLRALNAEYRARRIERAAAGLKTPPYNVFISHNIARLIYRDAEQFFGRSR